MYGRDRVCWSSAMSPETHYQNLICSHAMCFELLLLMDRNLRTGSGPKSLCYPAVIVASENFPPDFANGPKVSLDFPTAHKSYHRLCNCPIVQFTSYIVNLLKCQTSRHKCGQLQGEVASGLQPCDGTTTRAGWHEACVTHPTKAKAQCSLHAIKCAPKMKLLASMSLYMQVPLQWLICATMKLQCLQIQACASMSLSPLCTLPLVPDDCKLSHDF